MIKKYMTEPIIEKRIEQPYVGIPIYATLLDWDKVNALISEIFDWLDRKDIEPVGPPFYRYWVIGGIDENYELEVGVPVERMVTGNSRIIASSIPGGSYVTAKHRGHPDLLEYSLEVLEQWSKREELEFDKRWEGEDEIWTGRFEFYLTDPDEEPDLDKWEIEIAFLLMRDDAA
ncbi:GyrI-like domain-containing protein [Planococcus salinus]|uniref:AraC family transcriptional regulator n=1 Tax=Planococcus salinus TaxID=1848460 RepID=A0A3M8P732_9BACL|nr:GyrI-like domain-containing protein [Planococcus salinus]RNF39475.1 AraC family transcriptional regulator [Planococcus salinus]